MAGADLRVRMYVSREPLPGRVAEEFDHEIGELGLCIAICGQHSTHGGDDAHPAMCTHFRRSWKYAPGERHARDGRLTWPDPSVSPAMPTCRQGEYGTVWQTRTALPDGCPARPGSGRRTSPGPHPARNFGIAGEYGRCRYTTARR